MKLRLRLHKLIQKKKTNPETFVFDIKNQVPNIETDTETFDFEQKIITLYDTF